MAKKKWKSIFSIPKKTCPMCGQRVMRRISSLYCPRCGARLHSYRIGRKENAYTIWVTDEPRIKDIALYVRDKIRELPQMSEFDFGNWEQQLGNAHVLLDMCEGSQSLALAVVDACYTLEIRHECGIFGNMPRSVSDIISGAHRDRLAWFISWCKNDIKYSRADIEKPETVQVALL